MDLHAFTKRQTDILFSVLWLRPSVLPKEHQSVHSLRITLLVTTPDGADTNLLCFIVKRSSFFLKNLLLSWPVGQPLPRLPFKEGDREADRENGGKTSEGGLALNGISYCGQPRTTRSGGSWL